MKRAKAQAEEERAFPKIKLAGPVRGILVLGDKASENLAEAELATQRQEAELRLRLKRRRVVALTSSVVAGGGALMIARNLKRKKG
jgi:hypothetical protein